MDIYEILHTDHVNVLKALSKLHASRPGAARKQLLTSVVDELTAHTQAEEEVLYDRLIDRARELTLEAREEHLLVTRLLEELVTMRVEDERFTAKVKVLIDVLEHHIEEEEDEVWAAAKEAFDPIVAQNFAGEFAALKDKVSRRPIVMRFGEARLKKVVDDVGHVFAPTAAK
ncbi:MAG: hemerythrin domain-containing protein [Deltaproteobacteria bacterium]|nr:hemerythrin domain-containing protein [Deltaproteobacteria bacterium]